MSIYLEAQAIAASGKKILVMVSRGRDSLCMVQTLLDHVPRDRLVFLHLRSYQTLDYINQHLKQIEARFQIKLEIQPSRQANKMKTGKNGDFSKERDHWRNFYECDLSAYGFRMDESVSRACIMKAWSNGINEKSKECYPLKRWNKSIVTQYAKAKRLPMAVEYEYEYRDIDIFTGVGAVWLHDTFPDDFQRACEEDPNLGPEYTRATGNPL